MEIPRLERDIVIEGDSLPALRLLAGGPARAVGVSPTADRRRSPAEAHPGSGDASPEPASAAVPDLTGAVSVVYIDPPYNTGNRHSYNDSFSRDHAAWRALMEPRLRLARELMRDDGVLFLHIDDRESAHAQILGHEVFGEESFLGTLIHQRAKGGGNAKFFVRGHDYIHIWAKDPAQTRGFVTEKKAPAKYEVINGRRMLVEDDFLRVSFGRYARGTERRLMYEDIAAVRGPKKLAEVDAMLASGRCVLRPWGEPGPDGVQKHAVVRLTPAEEATSKLYSIIRALGEHGRADLDALGLGGTFGYPKPVELVRILVESQTWTLPDAIVLDFFAGSGTTAQAVMEANARDGGRRRSVLVQIPEPLRASQGAAAPVTVPSADAAGAAASAVTPAEAHPGDESDSPEPASGAGANAAAGAEATTALTTISALCLERVRRAAAKYGAPEPLALRVDGERLVEQDGSAARDSAAGKTF